MSAPKGRLLLVDDDPGVRVLISRILRQEGHEVSAVDSVASAEAWIASHETDLMLIDLKLGSSDGVVLIDAISSRSSDAVPFMVITGQGDERVAVEMMKRGALDYLVKSTEFLEVLPTVVNRALETIDRDRRLKKAQKSLEDSEARHRGIVQTALDGYIELNDDGVIVDLNPALCALIGGTRHEWLSRTLSDVEETTGGDSLTQRLPDLRKSGQVRFEGRVKVPGNATCPVEFSARYDGGKFFAFIHDLTRRRRLEQAILDSHEQGRRAIGRDLHDGLGQQLTGIGMMAQTLVRELRKNSSELEQRAKDLAGQIASAVTQTRQLSRGLSPVSLDAHGLSDALRQLAESVRQSSSIRCRFTCRSPVETGDPQKFIHLYRIAQEAVNNAVKHSGANLIRISLGADASGLVLTISDNGRGLKPRDESLGGLGLDIMSHRAQMMGAAFSVHSDPGRGVRIRCHLPHP